MAPFQSDSLTNRFPILGVNIDHLATLRNARGGSDPDLLKVAKAVIAGGARYITVHLREDRRHIRDEDLPRLLSHITVPLNLEMAATKEMCEIAIRLRPAVVCLVPESREELTTEGGLDVVRNDAIARTIEEIQAVGIDVSVFIDPDPRQIEAAASVSANAVEIHTGPYANAVTVKDREQCLDQLRDGVSIAQSCGLRCHAGHGLTRDNVGSVASIPGILELHIGHGLVCDAMFVGLTEATRRMLATIEEASKSAVLD